MGRGLAAFWVLLVLGATFAATQAQPTPDEGWMIPLVTVMWVGTALAPIPPLRRIIGAPLHWLRAHPILYWLIALLYMIGALALWIVPYQPTNGRQLLPTEYVYLLAMVWLLVFLIAYDLHEPEVRAAGGKLAKSKLTGVMVTITTLVVIFFAGEAFLRVFYITTDGYGFTAMNYWWYRNFGWSNLNSYGYRDYEPTPDDPDHPITRIGIVGDSFAMGHGINDIDDTFPQILERDLGAGYDVNLIASSGWDSDVELYQLDQYPLRPNIVILSYYLNDIDYLMENTDLNPNNNFAFPQNPAAAGFIRAFFLPNYIYYNLLQFASSTRASNFAYDLIGAHLNDALWEQQVPRLYEMVAWARDHNVRLIVLLWPELFAVDASTPATQRVREFFQSQDVEVVDMTDVLRDKSVGEITVNRFDSHPNVEANRLAAEQLEAVIRQEPAP